MGQAQTNVHAEHTAEHTKSLASSPGRDGRLYTIGDLSREFDVSLRTLRFYEDRDLLHPQRRGNSRLYSAPDRVRLQIILKGKKLGFTLTEIHQMLGHGDGQDENDLQLGLNSELVRAQIDHLERQRSELDVAISELRATHLRLAATASHAAA